MQCDAAWGSADKILSISIELGVYKRCRKIPKRSAPFFYIPVCERAHYENCMNDIQIFNDDLASIALKVKETNEVHVYEHPLFGKVRMFVENGKTKFCGTDIATSLGYSNPRDAIVRHCKSHGVVNHDVIDSMGRTQQMKFISEGNIYRLTAKSQMPKADEFESWIFDDIVPSVMQTGSYSVKPSLPKTYLEALKELLFELKDYEHNGHTGTQLLITPKGKETFRLMFSA